MPTSFFPVPDGTHRLSLVPLLLLACLACVACGKTAGLGGVSPIDRSPAVPAEYDAGTGQFFPGLPQLPAGTSDPPQQHQVSLAANVQEGSEAIETSPQGATVQGSDLLLAGAADYFAWGLYRWGAFSDTDKPLSLLVDLGPGADYSQCFVLASNYTNQRWDILGQFSAESQSFSYQGNISYLSPERNTYVVIVQSFSSTSLLDRLTLSSYKDVDAPAAPTGLRADQVLPREVTLGWDANTETDLQGYNVYRGPQDGPGLPNQQQYRLNDDIVLTAAYVDASAAEQKTYYYWVTALDATGNESGPSEVLEVTTPEDLDPAAPTNLTVSDIKGRRATLSWEAPADLDVQGYDVWIGPHDNFEQFEGTRWNNGLVTDLTYIVRNLQKDHDYWARVQAVDQGGHRSPLSNTVAFHTLANQPPVADFTFASYNSRGIPVTFYPATTTDGDDDLIDLSFSWDFDGDAVIDETTQGPDNVFHQYDIRGPYSVTLTVDDGLLQDSVTKTVFISSQVRYWLGPSAAGTEPQLIDVDARSDGRRAVLYKDESGSTFVAYFDGLQWDKLTTPVVENAPAALALTPDGFAVLNFTGNQAGTNTGGWRLHAYDGSWEQLASSEGSGVLFHHNPRFGDLAASAAGRLSVIVSGQRFISDGVPSQYNMACWHQDAQGNFDLVKHFGVDGQDARPDSAVATVRDNDSSWFFYLNRPATSYQLLEATDSGSSSTQYPSISALSDVCLTQSAADETRLSWALIASSESGRIRYGDNWGAADGGSQFFDVSGTLLGLSTTAAPDDNQLDCLYSVVDDSDNSQLRRVQTDPASDTELLAGIGLVGRARGAVQDAASDLFFVVCDETRDAELVGYSVESLAATQPYSVYQPLDSGYLGSRSQPLCFEDGTTFCIYQEHFPDALWLNYEDLDHFPTFGFAGYDNWNDPESAVILGAGHAYLTASVTPQNNILIHRFNTKATTTGLQLDPVSGGRFPVLRRHSANGEILLAYAGGPDLADLYVAVWDGAAFDPGQLLFDGSSPIDRLEMADNPAGGWGIVFLDAAKELRLVENSGSGWDPAQELDNGSGVSWKTGVGLAYKANGDLLVGVERTGVDAGFWAGLRSVGGLMIWEKMSESGGETGIGIACFYHIGIPMVAYYYSEGGVSAESRLRIAEKHSGSWFEVEQFAELQGLPFGHEVDADGNIILTGFSLAYEPTRAITYILTP